MSPEGDEEGEKDQEQRLTAGDQEHPCEEKLTVADLLPVQPQFSVIARCKSAQGYSS